MASKITTLYPYPEGWYSLGFSTDFPKGQVVTRKFVGKEVVVWRTASGKIAVSDPFCPHLGAHLGHGGKVVGESVKCPFHGFCFDTEGECTSTGYGTNPNPKGKLKMWHSAEVNGIVMVYHHYEEDQEPEWSIPQVENKNFMPLSHTMWEFHSHPQETSENSVDIGHFEHVHGYTGVEVLEPLQTEGPYLYSKYAMERKAGFAGLGSKIRAEFEVHLYGLGYSFVNAFVPELGMETHQFVLSTPVAPGVIQLRIAVAIRKINNKYKMNPGLVLLPTKLANKLVQYGTFKGFKHDVGQDFDIWQNKEYVHPPALAKGDGPVGQYRVWCKQFYPNKKEIIELERVV